MPPSLPSRFEYLQPLGQGGMGEVHRVFDRERGEDVALKLFRPAPGADVEEGRFLFKQEFWALAFLSHPNLVAAYDYGELADGTPYLTMAYVPGAELEAPMTEEAVRAWLPPIAAALGYLHGRGYVHGDLQPGNVRLGPDGHATLMDLGLLTPIGATGGPIRGTLDYLAPEVIMQGAVDARSDLYALGALLYHCLAGKPPFKAASPLALLKAHLEATPPALKKVSPALGAAVKRLLAKDPAARFPDAGALLEALGLEGIAPAEAPRFAVSLIGREAARRQIEALLADGPRTLTLAGPSGSGRSRLLAAARAEAQLAGLATWSARGSGVDAPPYQALMPWLRALAEGAGPERAAEAAVLARLAPVEGLAAAPALDGPQERARFFAAVATCARAQVGPALWTVDDADRLDPASSALLDHLEAQGADRPWRFLRAVAAADGAFALAPLSPDDLRQLAAEALDQADPPAKLLKPLNELAEGLPGRAIALLGHWRETQALVRRNHRWEVAGPLTAPEDLALALSAPLAALSPEALQLLRLAALLGESADLRLLRSLTGGAEVGFFSALAELERHQAVAQEGAALRFRSPALAPILAAGWAPDEARRLHGRAAKLIAGRLTGGPAEAPLDSLLAVARHHLAGDTPEAATPWVLEGARQSLALYAPAAAEPLLAKLLELELDPTDRLAAQGLLATCWRYQGQIDAALALIENTVLPAADKAPDRAAHQVAHAVLLQLKGRYGDALKAAIAAAQTAEATERFTDATRAHQVAARAAYFAGKAPEAARHAARAVAIARAHRLDALLAVALTFLGYLRAGQAEAREDGLALLAEAEACGRALGDGAVVHQALTNRGNVLLAAGRPAEARAAFAASLETCRRMDSPNELIFAILNLGASELELGALSEAAAHAAEARTMSQAQGRRFPEGFAEAVYGLATVRQGDGETGLAALERGLAIAKAIGNRYLELQVSALLAEAQVVLGRRGPATETLAHARDLAKALDNSEQTPRLDRLDATLAAMPAEAPALGADPDALALHVSAQPTFQAMADQAAEAFLALTGLDRGFLLLYRGLRVVHCSLAGTAEEPDAFSTGLAHQVLFSGAPAAIADLQTDPGLSTQASVQALGLRTAVGVPLWDEDELVGVLLADSSRLHPGLTPDVLSRLDGFARQVTAALLNARRLAIATTERDVLASLHRAALAAAGASDPAVLMRTVAAEAAAMTGAERIFLLERQGESETLAPTFAVDAAGAPLRGDKTFSTGIAGWVLTEGRPLHLADALASATFGQQKSVQALGLRTVLAAPVPGPADAPPRGVLYVDLPRLSEADPRGLPALEGLAQVIGAFLGRP